MIRLPATHAAITAPLVASATTFPGIPIGRSLLDGRPFHLSPVMVAQDILPSTNSLGMGGLGSGKSTTGKVRAPREIKENGHQYVVIDSFGEDADAGEWAALTRSLDGRVIDASQFTLNPCSSLFSPQVREQLVRSLILAVEPGALTPQSTHALQHALNHPKASHLPGLVDALVAPEDGRWPAAKLAEWGEAAAIALSRYTEGSMRGLFDGREADLPETDLPILSFDFSRLDRNSPAIPSLMAAVCCWVEHVWLPQSIAVHRHLVLEEAWQILLSPATSGLIQRLLKNSRKAALSLDVLMHTISDLGKGQAQDLARLCEVIHIGRLSPEEARIIGAILKLAPWVIDEIPNLDPGEAVWKVGPHYVDIVKTVLTADEIKLTDTSARRRRAQQSLTADVENELDTIDVVTLETADEGGELLDLLEVDDETAAPPAAEESWSWEMPPNIVDCQPLDIDTRHHDVIQAALQGRMNEAADLAALGEREDITAHGIDSEEATAWLSTRARVAELSGNPVQAAHLRASVVRMGKEVKWWADDETSRAADADPEWHRGPQPVDSIPESGPPQQREHRRIWPYVAASAVLTTALIGVWQSGDDKEDAKNLERKAAAYKGVSATDVTIDGVKTQLRASWTKDGRAVIFSAYVDPEEEPKFVRIDSKDQTAQEEVKPLRPGQFPGPVTLEIQVPIKDRYQPVHMTVAVGGEKWEDGTRAPRRVIEFKSDRTAHDVGTGESLKQRYSRLL